METEQWDVMCLFFCSCCPLIGILLNIPLSTCLLFSFQEHIQQWRRKQRLQTVTRDFDSLFCALSHLALLIGFPVVFCCQGTLALLERALEEAKAERTAALAEWKQNSDEKREPKLESKCWRIDCRSSRLPAIGICRER